MEKLWVAQELCRVRQRVFIPIARNFAGIFFVHIFGHLDELALGRIDSS